MLALLDRAARDRETAEADGAAPAGPMAELVALPDEVRAAFEAIGPLSDELIDAVSDAQDELDERLDVAFDAAERVAPRAFTGRSKGSPSRSTPSVTRLASTSTRSGSTTCRSVP
ncbi:hypothetical protein G7085_10345 [Tessaracoccus sp. HDW20]|uniref:hypothetical protein n=1 Tax=Tessaracoccus coleopterorum TaxID=2714950 RepID=UPI0018D43741|nr:hypothetical protein [Tessaracoccus coleopterorum]NHB84868.1 hypothetical protein [Tessaracoccus coleopterorum]